MTTAILKLAERKSFTAALVASALAVFICFAMAIATPGCAFVKSTLGPALATCGTSSGLTAAGQFNTIVQTALANDNFQAALTALENDGGTDAIQGVICAVQQVAFSEATPNTPAPLIVTAPLVPKFSAVQVAHARAYLAAHK